MRKRINDRYEVDCNGRVFSVTRKVRFVHRNGKECFRVHKGKELAQRKSDNGYMSINIDGKAQWVHRLIATAFVENPKNHGYVMHINGDRVDNRAENLKWITKNKNLLDAYDAKRHIPITHISQEQIDKAESLIAGGKSQTRAAELVGMSQAYLSLVRRKKYVRKRAEKLKVKGVTPTYPQWTQPTRSSKSSAF